MTSSFDSRSKTVGQLLGNSEERLTAIPPFQRSYSWEKTHILTFAADILDFHRTKNTDMGQRYFLGPVVVEEEKDRVILLDGQQRLATATILFSVIRDLARKYNPAQTNVGNDLARDVQRDYIEKERVGFALELNVLDKEFFRRIIQEENKATSLLPALRSHTLIQNARKLLETAVEEELTNRKLGNADAVAYLKVLKNTLANRVTVASITVGSEDDASMIFETLNDRGLRLSVPDLLLNHLMTKASDDLQRKSIREAWNEITQQLGQGDIDRFLRHMWLSKYGDVKSQGLFREIKDHIHDNRVSPLEFAESCQSEAESYMAILECDPQVIPLDAREDLKALVHSLGVQSALPLLLAGLRHLNQDDFSKMVRSALRLYVRHGLAANLNPGELETAYYESARTIRASAADATKPSGTHWHAAKAKLKAIDPTDEKVVTGAQDLELQGTAAHYILRQLANKLQDGKDEIEISKATIEHVFPRNPSPEWKNPAEMQPLVYCLGNLTLLGSRLNKESKNAPYEKKVPKYRESKIKMSNEIPANHKEWNKTEICKRSANLGQLFPGIWPSL